jgi:hypothetical protein
VWSARLGVAVDQNDDVFVAACGTSQSGVIFAYRSGETEPYMILGQGEPCPYFIGVGLNQELFASYVADSSVAVYGPGGSKPYIQFTTDLNEPVSAISEKWPSL